jgi:hypothetical protein
MTCSGNRLDQIALRSQFGQQDLRSKARGEHRVSLLTPDTQPRLPMTGAGLFREMPPSLPPPAPTPHTGLQKWTIFVIYRAARPSRRSGTAACSGVRCGRCGCLVLPPRRK